MFQFILSGLLLVHALIHGMGMVKAFRPDMLAELTLSVSRGWGVVWLSGAVLMAAAGVALLLGSKIWWAVALVAVVVSQLAIVVHFEDAKFGTLVNVVVLVAAIASSGDFWFQRKTTALVQGLGRAEPGQSSVASKTTDLPPPVRRYLEAVLPEGFAAIERVLITQKGTFNTNLAEPAWKPFSAKQVSVTSPPGFVWAADISMLPGVHAKVHDVYVHQKGMVAPSIAGIFPLRSESDTGGEVARGELLRFLAEVPWYPTVLRDSSLVQWSPGDEHSAHARLTDGSVVASLRFHFGSDGLIDEVYAESRGRGEGDSVVATPWRGRFWNYQRRAGVLVPIECEVEWLLESGPAPYFRAQVTSLEIETEATSRSRFQKTPSF